MDGRRPKPFMAARWRGLRGKGARGVRGRRRVEGGNRKREGVSGATGTAWAAGIGPQPAVLWRDMGGRRGVVRRWRERLTGGTERQQGLVAGGGVRKGEEEVRQRHHRGADSRGWPAQYRGTVELGLNRFIRIQRFTNIFKLPPNFD
jgi:hypothetical protein